jgi:predicted nucleic acid-binding protein
MNAAEVFFDTDVLLYLVSADSGKAQIAESVVAGGGHVSVQVLNEFVSVARRQARLDWPEIEEVQGVVRELCQVHPLTIESHDLACRLARDHGLSLFDASVVASALLAGCNALYSEDLQDGQVFRRTLRLQNPFAGGRRAMPR